MGSNGFYKTFIQLDGTSEPVGYRLSYSYGSGDGYHDHQAFRSNKLYKKLTFNPSEKSFMTQIISHIDYFQQNQAVLISASEAT